MNETGLVERVAAAMYEAPYPGDEYTTVWPPPHPEDARWWISRAEAAVKEIRGE